MPEKKKTGRDFPLAPTPTTDSSMYYGNKEYVSKLKALTSTTKPAMDAYFKESDKAKQDKYRQSRKGKPGYDAMGFSKKS
jgi:hypothetical protein